MDSRTAIKKQMSKFLNAKVLETLSKENVKRDSFKLELDAVNGTTGFIASNET